MASTTSSPIDSHTSPTRDTAGRSGKATGAFIIGIVGILAAFFIPIVGIILGIVGVALGISGRKDAQSRSTGNTWMANAGIALSALAIIAAIVIIAVVASSAS